MDSDIVQAAEVNETAPAEGSVRETNEQTKLAGAGQKARGTDTGTLSGGEPIAGRPLHLVKASESEPQPKGQVATERAAGHTETVRVAQQIVRMTAEAQNVDPRSSQFQCVVRVENGGPGRLHIRSLRPLNPLGVEVQQVIDASRSNQRLELDRVYADLSRLLLEYQMKEIEEHRKAVIAAMLAAAREAARALGKMYFLNVFFVFWLKRYINSAQSIVATIKAWTLSVRHSDQGRTYYKQFLEPNKDKIGDLVMIFEAKLHDATHLEDELKEGSDSEYVADVEPGATYTRTYVYNCDRRLLNPKTYTFSFDCGYQVSIGGAAPAEIEGSAACHCGASITATISPKPLILNLFAVVSAVLGALLKLELDAVKARSAASVSKGAISPDITPHPIDFGSWGWGFLSFFQSSHWSQILAAMLTALFFFNIYDSTEVGKKINVGTGWRSALLIGGLSGLMNEKVVAALQALIG
jgi:hypothetical protein